MTQIPGVSASVAQTHLTQGQQSSRDDKARQLSRQAADKAQLQQLQQREFVRDMAEAIGLVVDPDGRNEQETRKRKRQLDLGEAASTSEPAAATENPDEALAREHAAALLLDNDAPGPQVPPPCMIDIQA